MSAEMHRGSCHCGAVAFEATLDVSKPVACNCSRCQRLGALLAFAPRADFRLLRGEDMLTEYRFNTGKIAHTFCRTCGIQCFSFGDAPDGTPMVAVNVNCLEDVDPRLLAFVVHDGRAA